MELWDRLRYTLPGESHNDRYQWSEGGEFRCQGVLHLGFHLRRMLGFHVIHSLEFWLFCVVLMKDLQIFHYP